MPSSGDGGEDDHNDHDDGDDHDDDEEEVCDGGDHPIGIIIRSDVLRNNWYNTPYDTFRMKMMVMVMMMTTMTILIEVVGIF